MKKMRMNVESLSVLIIVRGWDARSTENVEILHSIIEAVARP